MNETRASLLQRAAEGDGASWSHLTTLYQPLIARWLRQNHVSHHDAEDLTQEVLLAVARKLPEFHHNGRLGAFRSWLRTVTVNRARDFWKARHGPRPIRDDEFATILQQLEDPDSLLSREWDRQHDEYLVRCLFDMMAVEFEPSTLAAFRRLALEGATAQEAANELGLSVGAVYVAKSGVLQRIRQVAEGLID